MTRRKLRGHAWLSSGVPECPASARPSARERRPSARPECRPSARPECPSKVDFDELRTLAETRRSFRSQMTFVA
jgi:hypothetical protein